MTEWPEFAAGLVETLATLPYGAVVIIGEPGPWSDRRLFTQFRQERDHIHAQLPGDRWLDSSVQVGASGARVFGDDGWHEPDADFLWNWWVNLPWPATSAGYRRLAAMMVTALRDVFGIPSPDDLVYYAWNEGEGNARLELPLLGVRYEPDEG